MSSVAEHPAREQRKSARSASKSASSELGAAIKPTLISQVKAARRAGVPIVGITTADPGATIRSIVDSLKEDDKLGGPMLQWDVVEGVRHLNEAGKEVRSKLIVENDPTVSNPLGAFLFAKNLPGKAILFFHLANRWVVEGMAIQSVWNLRDVLKSDMRMLVLLAIDCQWPPELAGDIVVLDEPLPDAAALERIIHKTHESAGLDVSAPELVKIVEAVQGLPAFQAEQVVAMSLKKSGCDVPALWERKRQQIEMTPGLKVMRDGTTFADIGGVTVVKDFLGRVMKGQARPNAVVFIDEIEKFLAGATGGGGDSSGVSQDQLGQLLSYMQDHKSAKSMVAKAAGNEGLDCRGSGPSANPTWVCHRFDRERAAKRVCIQQWTRLGWRSHWRLYSGPRTRRPQAPEKFEHRRSER